MIYWKCYSTTSNNSNDTKKDGELPVILRKGEPPFYFTSPTMRELRRFFVWKN
ncbi:MAG: hypothetical protein ACLSFW_10045 [Bacteroides cellulosilyticus]